MKIRDIRRIGIGILTIIILLLNLPAAARAQAAALYFPRTGHHLTDEYGFLTFWREHDGPALLGFPITEAIAAEGAAPLQYFEKGRLEQVAGADGSPVVHTGNVAAEYVAALYRSFPPRPDRPPAKGEVVVAETGHGVREPFVAFWQVAGGIDFFGAPMSEAFWERTGNSQRQVQYFQRARLERDPAMAGTPQEILVSDLGRALAELNGLNIAPIANWGAESFGPAAAAAPDIAPLASVPEAAGAAAPQPTAAPRPAAAPTARPATTPATATAPAPMTRPVGAAKLIVVNLTKQWLYAYEGEQLVFDAPVATGRDGMNTPTGTFSIYAKLPVQTMDGVTDGEYWVVPNVPNVMYIHGGVALHGTYWHNLFGTGARPSHGCVNLPLKSAAWLYKWAPIGTTVRVTN